jgi:hypothetical protein
MSSDDTIKPIDAGAHKLIEKLDEGYERIELAQAAGDGSATVVLFWMELLNEYDDLCRLVTGETAPRDE